MSHLSIIADTTPKLGGPLDVPTYIFFSPYAGVEVAGAIWNDSTQKTMTNFTSGIKQYMGGTIFVQIADATVANTADETTLVGAGIGTTTLPTDFFLAGRAFRITANGYYSTRHDVTTLQIKVKLGTGD